MSRNSKIRNSFKPRKDPLIFVETMNVIKLSELIYEKSVKQADT